MHIRHTAKKSFGKVDITKAIIYYNVPMYIQLRGNVSSSFFIASEKLGVDKKPLAQLTDIDLSTQEYISTAKKMFPDINPNTGDVDVTGNEFYADLIPKSIVSNIITPQVTENGTAFFNGEGTITIAEVLDGINSIESSSNSDEAKHLSLDNVSTEADYFNEGYNKCCWGYSSPFFNLYTREELLHPITRIELAYIVVMCSGLFSSIFDKQYEMGITFDWLRPRKVISEFDDWNKYNISLITIDDSPKFDIREYRNNRTMENYLLDIKSGKSAIPLPMIMSLVELGVQGLFYFADYMLNPMKQVSRGEVAYLLTKIATYDKQSI